MARFYQTSGSNFVADKMLDLPYELMAKVITNTDKNIDDTINSSVSLYDKLEANSLTSDTPRLQEIFKGYEGNIDEIVSQIQKNPLEYSRKIGDIRKLGRDIQSQFTNGEVGAIQGRYNQDQAWWTEAKELQKKNPELYDDDYLRKLRNKNLEESGSINFKGTGDYNQYSSNSVMGLANMNEWVDARLKDAIPDAESIEQDSVSGGWIVTTKEGSKTMTANELNDILSSSFEADQSLQQAILQRESLGMEGFKGLSTNGILNPISQTSEVEVTDSNGNPVKVPMLQFANNMLGNSFRAGVKKFGFQETDYSSTRKADPYALKAQDLRDKMEYKKWEDNKDFDYIEVVTNSKVSSVAGGNSEEYSQNVLFTQQKMQDLKDNVSSVIKSEAGLGENSTLPLEVQAAIDKGNFSYLTSMTKSDGSPMFQSGVIENLASSYKEEQLNMSILESIKSDWETSLEKRYAKDSKGLTLEEYKKANELDFNRHLKETEEIATTQKFTWEGTNIEPSQIKAFQKNLVESNYHTLVALNLDKDSTAKDKNGNVVNLNGKSIEQLLRAGIVEKEDIKKSYTETIPATYTNPSDKTKEKKLITPETQEIRYRMVDGSGYIGFDVSPESIVPSTSYGDSRKVDLGMVVNFKGEKRFAKIDDITSTKLKGFQNINADMLKTNYYLTKMSNAGEVVLPNLHGMKIVNVKDAKGKTTEQLLKIPNVEGGFDTETLDNPNMRIYLNNVLNR